MIRLSVQIEFDKVLDLDTLKSIITVGRSSHCDVIIPHHSISRQHCQIEWVKKCYYITDLCSSNGVFIDDERIAPNQRVRIPQGNVLRLGSLTCELSERAVEEVDPKKLLPTPTSLVEGDTKVTMRIARMDIDRELNRPAPVELTVEELKSRRPRNPISHCAIEETKVEENSFGMKRAFCLVLLLTLMVFGYKSYKQGRPYIPDIVSRFLKS